METFPQAKRIVSTVTAVSARYSFVTDQFNTIEFINSRSRAYNFWALT